MEHALPADQGHGTTAVHWNASRALRTTSALVVTSVRMNFARDVKKEVSQDRVQVSVSIVHLVRPTMIRLKNVSPVVQWVVSTFIKKGGAGPVSVIRLRT
ncbi:hypothetical protein BWQ96_10562 [Gracilariopsis chorda]|uniref:Uncharacterized protein n=1 Tax=Gracilariopsis chorda TaxID=448386 RepID=A0A2V3ICA9_9FLOR|nr:hypothetical protein BWQ96_10562 [Gracilariopsis chorda]|eukprot:PXF39737.1 hypothetical protein BWQ96_10562 [Gracilariopsis chorda]